MEIVVTTSQKGGSGKTTVTAHLAVAAERVGHGPSVVIDTDPQQTLATWWKVREAEAPKLAPISLRELPDKLAVLAQMGFTYCFIDTPPALTEQNRQVLGLADLILIPTRPSPNDLWSLGATLDLVKQAGTPLPPNDLWSLGATLDLVKQAGTPFVFVLTQAKGNAQITVQTLAALSEHGQVLQSVIHDRVDYAASMTDGRTALEIRPSGPAAAEVAALWGFTRVHLEELANLSETANTEKRAKDYV